MFFLCKVTLMITEFRTCNFFVVKTFQNQDVLIVSALFKPFL